MSKVSLVDKKICTACGVCAFICPTNSIYFKKDECDNIFPVINFTTCVSCGKCKMYCHEEQAYIQKNEPKYAYVAWNNESTKRQRAASGGIATAIYDYCLEKKYKTFGVSFSIDKGAYYKEIKTKKNLIEIQNSKYCYSRLADIFYKVKEYIDAGEKVIIPALPCQAAALIALCGGRRENLTIIDIVCHGVCSYEYLRQHIEKIEKVKRSKVNRVYFRDPTEGTNNFVLSLYEGINSIYKAEVLTDDVYQLGYHKALIYRENCYHCKYAQRKRVGDLTISDFTGIGRLKDYSGPKQSISCVLVSSEKGKELLDDLVNAKLITCQARPLEEALVFEKQLNHPSIPHKNRKAFLDNYKKNKDFEISANLALKKEIFLYRSGLRTLKRKIKVHQKKFLDRVVKSYERQK